MEDEGPSETAQKNANAGWFEVKVQQLERKLSVARDAGEQRERELRRSREAQTNLQIQLDSLQRKVSGDLATQQQQATSNNKQQASTKADSGSHHTEIAALRSIIEELRHEARQLREQAKCRSNRDHEDVEAAALQAQAGLQLQNELTERTVRELRATLAESQAEAERTKREISNLQKESEINHFRQEAERLRLTMQEQGRSNLDKAASEAAAEMQRLRKELETSQETARELRFQLSRSTHAESSGSSHSHVLEVQQLQRTVRELWQEIEDKQTLLDQMRKEVDDAQGSLERESALKTEWELMKRDLGHCQKELEGQRQQLQLSQAETSKFRDSIALRDAKESQLRAELARLDMRRSSQEEVEVKLQEQASAIRRAQAEKENLLLRLGESEAKTAQLEQELRAQEWDFRSQLARLFEQLEKNIAIGGGPGNGHSHSHSRFESESLQVQKLQTALLVAESEVKQLRLELSHLQITSKAREDLLSKALRDAETAKSASDMQFAGHMEEARSTRDNLQKKSCELQDENARLSRELASLSAKHVEHEQSTHEVLLHQQLRLATDLLGEAHAKVACLRESSLKAASAAETGVPCASTSYHMPQHTNMGPGGPPMHFQQSVQPNLQPNFQQHVAYGGVHAQNPYAGLHAQTGFHSQHQPMDDFALGDTSPRKRQLQRKTSFESVNSASTGVTVASDLHHINSAITNLTQSLETVKNLNHKQTAEQHTELEKAKEQIRELTKQRENDAKTVEELEESLESTERTLEQTHHHAEMYRLAVQSLQTQEMMRMGVLGSATRGSFFPSGLADQESVLNGSLNKSTRPRSPRRHPSKERGDFGKTTRSKLARKYANDRANIAEKLGAAKLKLAILENSF